MALCAKAIPSASAQPIHIIDGSRLGVEIWADAGAQWCTSHPTFRVVAKDRFALAAPELLSKLQNLGAAIVAAKCGIATAVSYDGVLRGSESVIWRALSEKTNGWALRPAPVIAAAPLPLSVPSAQGCPNESTGSRIDLHSPSAGADIRCILAQVGSLIQALTAQRPKTLEDEIVGRRRLAAIEVLLNRLPSVNRDLDGKIHQLQAILRFLAFFYDLSDDMLVATKSLYTGQYRDAESRTKKILARFDAASGNAPDLGSLTDDFRGSLGLFLADIYAGQHRDAEAEEAFRDVIRFQEQRHGPEWASIGTTLSDYGAFLERIGRYAEAVKVMGRALDIRLKGMGPNDPIVGSVRNNLAIVQMHRHQYVEAEKNILLAKAAFERPEVANKDHLIAAYINLGDVYTQIIEFQRAEIALKEGLSLAQQEFGAGSLHVANVLRQYARLYVAEGSYEEARAAALKSHDIVSHVLGPADPYLASMMDIVAESYEDQGQIDAALEQSAAAVRLLHDHLSLSGTASGPERQLNRDIFLRYIRLVHANQKVKGASFHPPSPDTLAVVQLARASATGEAVNRMALRLEAIAGPIAALIRDRQDTATRWAQLGEMISATQVKATADRDDRAESALFDERTAAGRHLRDVDLSLQRNFPGYAALSHPEPLSGADVQALLQPGEAFVTYLLGADESWAWAIRADRPIGLYRLPIGAAQVATLVTKLRRHLDPDTNPGWAPFDVEASAQLYGQILAPLLPTIDGARAITVVPDGALQSLPFEVLVTRPSAPGLDLTNPQNYRKVPWLVRDVAITVAPSIDSLAGLRRSREQRQPVPRPFLGVGDPVLGTGTENTEARGAGLFRGTLGNPDAIRTLPSLPETAGELQAVGKLLGAPAGSVLLQEQATVSNLMKLPLDQYRVIQFATHGLLTGQLGLPEPALVLTPPQTASPADDGLLTTSRIVGLRLNAAWVVLSACNTAASDGTPDAEGLSGLARAFFYAGSRSLLVSHWPVNSDAAVRLTTGVFSALASHPDISHAEALRRSELSLIDDATLDPRFAHPQAWAPFVLVGGGSD